MITTAPALTPLRSSLFVPAANPRALEKSLGIDADALIYDLEDSAAPQEKGAARERLVAFLRENGRGRALRAVRINTLEEGGAEDIAALGDAPLDAVLLPKVDGPDHLAALDAALTKAGAPASAALWAMVETPAGILSAPAIAAARLSRPVGALIVGPNDIVLFTGIRPSPDRAELLPWMMQVVLAGKAAGVPVLDGVYNDFRDEAGYLFECEQGRRLGFTGKTLIHPSQVQGANAAFAPSAEEVAEAQAIVAAFAAPENASRGVIQMEGRMVERLHLKQAEGLLAIHAATEGRQG